MRYCEYDACEEVGDTDEMVCLGDEWYCLRHGAEVAALDAAQVAGNE